MRLAEISQGTNLKLLYYRFRGWIGMLTRMGEGWGVEGGLHVEHKAKLHTAVCHPQQEPLSAPEAALPKAVEQ